MGKQCSSNGLWGMRASGYSSRSSLYRGLFENGGKSPEQGAECEVEVYHLQKRHPDAGRFRLWSLLDRDDISVRTVGRIMALNKQVYDDIPHVARQRRTKPARPHP